VGTLPRIVADVNRQRAGHVADRVVERVAGPVAGRSAGRSAGVGAIAKPARLL